MLVQELNIEECHLALAQAGFGRLACARDNQPYVIPIHFAVDEAYVYGFSLAGQKLEWMRDNACVCLEIDNVNGASDWTSVVVLGRFEELPDTPEYRSARGRAHDLLQDRPMWWEPGTVGLAAGNKSPDFTPVYYRVSMEHVTGRRGAPSPEQP
jgi:nitroimidazol reductase NimA-like FMN-containing flavoprotein (pyridoxamine 5'-phosphate oxidase superfamily)